MKAANHGLLHVVTVTDDDGVEVEFEGHLLLCGPAALGVTGFTGLALREPGSRDLLYVEIGDRVEVLR